MSWYQLEELVSATLVRPAGAWALRPGTTATRAVRSYRNYGDSGPSATCQAFQNNISTTKFDFYTLDQLQLYSPLSVR